jgi:alkanesulfonate monooxygenase SsuD/methylene tetrahydromethanopterin reductase-like flavin-dependent oxidoreductase (luciferase family)
MCTCIPYRNPALLAKIAASVDAISGGRLDVGIGAGWSAGEFKGYGYEFPPNKTRLDMLEEAAELMKTMWTTDVAHFAGEHYRLEGAITHPKPIQKPHPPLWIAGGGEKRTLRIVARFGDYANFSGDIENFRRKSEVLAGHCEEEGRKFEEIGRSVHQMTVIGRDDADLARKLEVAGRRRNCTGAEFAEEHFAATVGEAVEMLGEYQDAGCSDMILYFYDMGAYDSLELFATEVMPQLRSR